MTHVGDVTNGASLEDCHTNFFALADLNGIKWKILHSDTVAVDPLDDPVLTSYSKCLSAGMLAAWKAVITQKTGTPGAIRELNSLSSSKELWIFWYGEEPDFSEFIPLTLTELDQGNFETGLNYEGRTLLFKALHNLIERYLLSHGYTRLGQYFVEPQVLDRTNKKTNRHLVFSLHFFIHGESTVCTCIDARLTSPVYALQKSHITAAQANTKNVKVILSPFGMEGKLTGQCYKYSDPNMARFLNNWHSFYPHIHRKDKLKADSDMPNVVEVLVGGVYMKYPVSYVFVVEEDHAKTMKSSKAPDADCSTLQPSTNHAPAPGLLTPPMSPIDGYRDNSRVSKDLLNDTQITLEDSFEKKFPKFHDCVKYSVSQECCIPAMSEKSDDCSTLWDFQDPSAVIKCLCCSKINKGKNLQTNSSGNGFSTSNQQSESSVSQRSFKNEKFNSPYMGVPFHRQKPNKKEERLLQNICISFLSKDPEKHEVKSSDTNSSCISNLPQLQTPSNHIKSESLTNASSTDTFYASVSSLDPVMPTLSPQPPMIKEESNAQSCEFSQASSSSPCMDSPNCVNLKGKISDEILSPLHASLLNMFENAKNVSKLSPIPANSEPEPAEDRESSARPRSNKSQNVEKPQLPKRSHEDDHPQMTMMGLLYDYQTFNAPLWEPPAAKRKCFLATQKSVQVFNDESDDSDGENALNNFDCSEAVTSAPKDPYEFTEFDETSPSERGFRQKTDPHSKEEEKFIPPSLPSPIALLSPIPNDPATAQEALISHDSDKVPSPAAIKLFPSKFIREEDLAVSLHDLDNIFDTSSSEGEDNADPPITPSKLHPLDEFSGKIELSRMYPTPPSLEQNAVPSPFGIISGSESIADHDAIKENHEDILMKNLNLNEDINIWKPLVLQKFVESPKYLYITELLSMKKCSDTNLDLVYKSSWFQPSSKMNYTTICEENAQSENFSQQQVYGSYDEERVCHTIYQSESALDSQFTLSNCDSVSSVSSMPSYLNKSNNSTDSNYSRPVLEAHPLYVNLILSDSMLNIFKDHNFDSCCLCVCNLNIKGSDAGNILPSFLIPSGNDEPQYKCTCGFSAVMHRHRSFNAGLFFEDEYEITGIDCDTIKNFSQSFFDIPSESQPSETQKVILPHSNHVPDFILDLLRIQCKSINSRFSLFYKSRMLKKLDSHAFYNAIEIYDRCEISFLALEDSKNSIDNPIPSRLDESLKSTCLHKWPYVSSPLPSTSEDIMLCLDSLKPILQAAVHKKNTQRMWDITYVVSGPLTWREFHTLAARGSEDQCDPQPIPSLLMGQDHECIAVSPFALKFWDKLHLEPYSLQRDIAYIVVAPENDFVLSHIKIFFKELSIIYESHGLGKHRPITKVLRDGIMRVGKTAASKVAEEPVGEWFNNIGDGSISNKLKLYARVCRHRLAPHLSTLTLDKTIFSSNNSSLKSVDKNAGLANTTSSSAENSADKPTTPKPGETEVCTDSLAGSQTLSDQKDDDHLPAPALVIYIVEPFTFAQCDSEVYRLVTLGLLHSYDDMLSCLPDTMKHSIQLQILSLDSILCYDDNKEPRTDQIKSLAFSVFSQSHQLHSSQSNAKSLTGFGPAAAQDTFLKSEKNKVQNPRKVYNQPFILASVKDKQTELNEMFGDRKQSSGVLYCSYCLTKDKRFILASCTNDKGEFTETNIINISIPNKNQRKYASVRKYGLRKLLDFILEVISVSVQPWRLVIERFGRLGHGELKTWAFLLSRKAMQSYSRRLRELCNQCAISEAPSILSACLVSVEPDSALRLMPDQFTPDGSFSNSRSKTCHLSTPEDATCTHILVFPTSATTQPSQAHKEQDPLLPGLGEDLFAELNDDISGHDINEILQWSESPGSPENSHRDGFSQPSSPTSSYRYSSTHHGDSHRGENSADGLDEPLQILQQPLALGYYVSTAETGALPKWFWSSCPQMENKLPVFLKSSLLIHLPFAQYSEDVVHNNPQQIVVNHPLDSNFTTDILRYVLEGHNALSWLALDPKCNDRRSCLPIHMQILMQLYDIVEAIL